MSEKELTGTVVVLFRAFGYDAFEKTYKKMLSFVGRQLKTDYIMLTPSEYKFTYFNIKVDKALKLIEKLKDSERELAIIKIDIVENKC